MWCVLQQGAATGAQGRPIADDHATPACPRTHRLPDLRALRCAAPPPREAAVHGIGAVSELRRLRAEARKAAKAGPPPPRPLGPRPAASEGPAWEPRLGRYTLPFPGEMMMVCVGGGEQLGMLGSVQCMFSRAAFDAVRGSKKGVLHLLCVWLFQYLAQGPAKNSRVGYSCCCQPQLSSLYTAQDLFLILCCLCVSASMLPEVCSAAAPPAPAGADAAIVRCTQAALAAAGEPPVHFTARFAVPSAFTAGLFVVYGGLMMFLCRFSWGRALLLRWGGAGAGLMAAGYHSGRQQHWACAHQSGWGGARCMAQQPAWSCFACAGVASGSSTTGSAVCIATSVQTEHAG
jgi:hypothetical protein